MRISTIRSPNRFLNRLRTAKAQRGEEFVNGQAERFAIPARPLSVCLSACSKIPWGPVFAQKAVWQDATSEHTRQRSVSEEQRRQTAFGAKTLRAAGLLPAACVGSALQPAAGMRGP